MKGRSPSSQRLALLVCEIKMGGGTPRSGALVRFQSAKLWSQRLALLVCEVKNSATSIFNISNFRHKTTI
ncbi:hypothetical protein [Campylobacter lanienae]|uniref:hypothetical protein n=1 Tax=Campylobacter lanienae TaxID=75658 RepID=UPI00112FA95D|nr:hypothetical protein [Campylobacter lanienae]